MIRNIPEQLQQDKGVDIRMPSSALLGVSSVDRYRKIIDAAANGTSPFNVLLTSGQNFLNGFFTRVALTEAKIPWFIPTITDRNNTIDVLYYIGGVPTTYTITLTNGWYDPATLAAELEAEIQAADPSMAAVTVNWNQAGTEFNFLAETNVVGELIAFFPTLSQAVADRVGLFEMMNWTNLPSATNQSGVPTMLSTEFVDIVCSQLTYAQNVKDGDTGSVTRDLVARIYLAEDGTDTAPYNLGSTPFTIYRQFQTPKQIKWDNNLPLGQLKFELYDDRGNLLGDYNSPSNDKQMGNWNITLLVSEV